MRVPGYVPPTEKTPTGQAMSDEPSLKIVEVRNASDNAPLVFALDDQETTLRVHLREAVAPNAAVEIDLKFKGTVPEIDPEETGLITHVVTQVSAAIRSTRGIRRWEQFSLGRKPGRRHNCTLDLPSGSRGSGAPRAEYRRRSSARLYRALWSAPDENGQPGRYAAGGHAGQRRIRGPECDRQCFLSGFRLADDPKHA